MHALLVLIVVSLHAASRHHCTARVDFDVIGQMAACLAGYIRGKILQYYWLSTMLYPDVMYRLVAFTR